MFAGESEFWRNGGTVMSAMDKLVEFRRLCVSYGEARRELRMVRELGIMPSSTEHLNRCDLLWTQIINFEQRLASADVSKVPIPPHCDPAGWPLRDGPEAL